MVPQAADDVGGGDVVGVVSDQATQESTVLTQIVLSEIAGPGFFVVRSPSGQLMAHDEVVSDEGHSVDRQDGPQEPHHEAKNAADENKEHPEVKEAVDLLVVKVDWQHALHRVALHIAQVLTAYEKVTQGDSRKSYVTLLSPVL